MDLMTTLHHLGVTLETSAGPDLRVRSPIDGALLASLRCPTRAEVDASIAHAVEAFLVWRDVPAPHRGTLVRLFGEAVRAHKEPLARLVTLENGKLLEEARGEVQEMIDMCDFAVGLSRQLYGLTIATERPDHGLYGEEHGVAGDQSSPWRWIVDPIDGTSNFVRGVPVWATLIALAHGDDGPVLGVVSAPAMRRRWWATREERSVSGRQNCIVSRASCYWDSLGTTTLRWKPASSKRST